MDAALSGEAARPHARLVTPELAESAQALRRLLDVESAPDSGALGAACLMRAEECAALDAARAALRDAWATLLVEALVIAYVLKPAEAHVAGRMPAVSTSPAAVLRDACVAVESRYGPLSSVPDYITPVVISWAGSKVSLGRGGGKARKLSRDRIRGLLFDAEALAREMAIGA